MTMKHLLTLLALSLATFCVGQNARKAIEDDVARAGAVYYAYPRYEAENSAAPEGYVPFYISHYGRHGSRYLLGEDTYTKPLQGLRRAAELGALTQRGEQALSDLEAIWREADGRVEALSPRGVREQRGIAERLYANYPEVFRTGSVITAVSTTVMRCALTMCAFSERLKELNPQLVIEREAVKRNMHYLNNYSDEAKRYADGNEWREEYEAFKQQHSPTGDKMMEMLFGSNAAKVEKEIDKQALVWQLYWIAVGVQNIETTCNFFDLFTADELYDMWQCFNADMYIRFGNYAGNSGVMAANSVPLLQHIIDEAESAMSSGYTGATLRFGHDTSLMSLLALMNVAGASEVATTVDDIAETFQTWHVTPMAANVQLIFFNSEDTKKPVLVKILLNECEVKIRGIEPATGPYYDWNALRTFYQQKTAQ